VLRSNRSTQAVFLERLAGFSKLQLAFPCRAFFVFGGFQMKGQKMALIRQFRVSPSLASKIDRRAAQLGLSPSSYLRFLIARDTSAVWEADRVSTD
jgi:hypothetical protein